VNHPLAGTVADLAWLLVALPFLGFLLNGLIAFVKPAARGAVTGIGVGVIALAFGLTAAIFGAMLGAHSGEPYVVELWTWMTAGNLEINAALQVDQLSIAMALVITGVGLLIHIFSIGYMGGDPGYARYFAYLNLFVAFMLVLVLGASFPVVFVGWEGVGLCSYLLIGFWFTDAAKAAAGLKAFVVNRIGDAGFLLAMFLIWKTLGSLDFVAVNELAPRAMGVGDPRVTAIALLLFLACCGKSAQIPLFTWLPDAMAGPTPVSALIHAATMVTGGVFLVVRANIFFGMSPVAMAVVSGVGALTALFAATIGLKQWDIKKVLAYSTVSQLGYMFVGVGTAAYAAGLFHVITHAFFKALLFLGAGSVIHAMHHALHHTHSHADPQDMRNMGGLKQYLPWTWRTMLVATLAIAGIPPLSGFFSKDEILAAAFARGHDAPFYYVVWFFGVVAAFITAFYMTRMMIYTFHGPNRTGQHEREHLHEPKGVMTVPLVILAVLTAVGGVINLPHFLPGSGALHHWLEPVVRGGAAAAGAEQMHLALSTEFILIGLAVLVGAGGIWLAWTKLMPKTETMVPAGQAAPETGFGRILYEKYRVDEIYDAVIVRPIVWISRNVFWKVLDAGLVDGVLVNGSAFVARTTGWLTTRFQTGQLGTYAVIFVLGVVALLATMVK